MVGLVSPVYWVDVEGLDPSEQTPTVSSAVQQWLNVKNLDLANLTKEDLSALIQHLKTQYPDSPEITAFARRLEKLEGDWSSFSPGRDKVQNALTTIDFQTKFLTMLNRYAPGQDGLDEAIKGLSGLKQSLTDLGPLLTRPPIDWSVDQNAAQSMDFVQNLIKKLEQLAPEQRQVLGLEDLYNNLKAALAAYKSAEPAAGGDPTKLAIAQSSFRTAIGEAMVKYMSESGNGASAVATSWQQELEQESNYYNFLIIPMDEKWVPPPTGYTLESLDTAWSEADRMYKSAVARGDTVAANYFSERKEIISNARAELKEAKSPAQRFLVSIHLYMDLLTLNEARLTVMFVQVKDTDQNLADKIQERIKLTKDLQNEVKKGGTDLLERLAAVYQASRV
ncbi:MAG TPA: hypothetical protein VFV39_01885 [Limnobacter sp.]|nr:hypothetical protein [Limnobacter sp.]